MKSVTYFLSTLIALFIVGCTGDQNPQNLAQNYNPESAAVKVSSQAAAVAIPPAAQIVDSQNNVWTVSNGVIFENGQHAGYSANVILLLYYNGIISQENAAGGWWSWTGTTWSQISGDPRLTVSASGTTIPSASQIVDSQNNVWAVSNGVILENGQDAGYSANVILLLYYEGVISQENASHGWWSWTGTTWNQISGDPRGTSPTPTPTPKPTPTATPKPTPSPTVAPTATPKPTVAPTATPTATPQTSPPPTTAIQDFNYPSGFPSDVSNVMWLSQGGGAAYNGSIIELTAPRPHGGGGLFYMAQQNIQTFMTQFTFQFTVPASIPATAAMAFVVQNSNDTTNPRPYFVGYTATGDANVGGYPRSKSRSGS